MILVCLRLAAVGLLVLGGCTHDPLAADKYLDRSAAADQLEQSHDAASDPGTQAPIRKSRRVYLGDNDRGLGHGDPLPDRVEGPNGFVLTSRGPISLHDLVLKVSKYANLQVVVDEGGRMAEAAKASPLPKDGPIQTINDLFPFNGMPGALAPTREVSGYRGPLSGFLNQELPKYDTDWEVHGQVIYVGKEIIRAYPVVDMPSNTTLSAGLNNNGSSTVAGGYTGTGSTSAASNSLGQSATGSTTTGQSSSTTTNIDSWKELLSTLAAYTGDSKKVYAEPSNGRVTIRCSRYCQGEVVRYIREHNRTAGRTVLLTVAILTTQKKGSDDYGFNPKLIYQNLPTGYTFSILGQTAATDTSLGGAISGGVLNPPAGSMAAKFNGTTLAVQAISQDEEVTGKLQKFGFVSNNRPFSVRNALDYGYVQSIVTAVGSTLSSTGAQIATDVIGDQLQILPRIQADGFIRLQLALSRTSIQSITQVTMGSTQTTIPQVLDNSSSPQEFTIRDGATLIVSDISTDTSDRVRSGAGSVYNWLLGGYANTSNEKDKAIIIVTAREWHPGDEGLGVVGGVVP